MRRRGYSTESKTFATKAEAEKWARKVESSIDAGVFVSAAGAEKTTLGEMLDVFERDFAPHHYRVRADKSEAWRFQLQRLRGALGQYSLAALDARLVAKYRDEQISGKKIRPGVADVDFHRILTHRFHPILTHPG